MVPLPDRAARAGLEPVAPSRLASHTTLQWALKASSLSVSGAPSKYVPVPTAIPTESPVKNCPTAGDDSITWSALYSHSRPPVGLPVPLVPVGEIMRRCPPWVYWTQLASPAV